MAKKQEPVFTTALDVLFTCMRNAGGGTQKGLTKIDLPSSGALACEFAMLAVPGSPKYLQVQRLARLCLPLSLTATGAGFSDYLIFCISVPLG